MFRGRNVVAGCESIVASENKRQGGVLISLVAAVLISCLFFSSAARADEIITGTGLATWSYPFFTSYDDARTQTIYLVSEMTTAPSTISSLSLYITIEPGQTMNNFTIRMKHTDLSAYGSSPVWESTGWTTVYQASPTILTTGWVQFNFSSTFAYNGSQNLMVDISFNNSSSISSPGYCRFSSPGGTRTIYRSTDSAYGDPLNWSSQTPAMFSIGNVPNLKLGVTFTGVAMPAFSPGAGTYNIEQDIIVTCATGGATIHYTTNGADPNESDPVIASGGSVLVDHDLILKAKAWKEGLPPSAVNAAAYTVQVAMPAFSLAGGTYNTERDVVITCATAGATIHYTTNGVDPTESDPVIASGGSVYVDRSLTLKAKAWKGSMDASAVKSAAYTIQIATPTFSPVGGTYNLEQNVFIACATAGATIHYTTNGVDPTESDPVIASGSSVIVDHSLVLKAKAWKGAMTPSAVKSGTYTLVVAMPAFSLAGGTYNTARNVVITCATAGATIHYTTNGVDPTESDPVIASGSSVLVDHSLTLKAKAWKGALTPSSVRSASYTLQVATPVFSPDGGTYNTETMYIVITCSTAGATIHYTTNGNDPNESDPCIAAGASITVSVEPPTIVKAKGFRPAFSASGVKVALYYRKAVSKLYVSPDGNNIADGMSWATAKKTLQAALDMVDVNAVEIWVAAGTYYPTSDNGLVARSGDVQARLKHFKMKDNVSLYGGFAGNETSRSQRNWRSNVTILSGDIGVAGDANDNCYNVFLSWPYLYPGAAFIVDGFTVTGGNSNGPNWPHGSGSGMKNSDNSPTIENCIFTANTSGSGGATIENNMCESFITKCVFAGNTASTASTDVFAVSVNLGYATISGCTFVGNRGYGLFVQGYGRSLILNCDFVGNSLYGMCNYGSLTDIRNCIFHDNGSGQIDAHGNTSVEYSYVQGGYPGTGNVSGDPDFVRDPSAGADGVRGTADDDWGDLRLRAGSVCVDAGNNIDANSPTDLAGYPRIIDGNGDANSIADMGVYERQCVANPVGDVSYDCGIDFIDYGMLVSRWGQGGCTAGNWWCYWADVNQSGVVDIIDMSMLAANWLEGR